VGRFAIVAFAALVAVVVLVVSDGDKRTRHIHTQAGPPHAPAGKKLVFSVDSTIGSSGCPQPAKDINEMTPQQIAGWLRSCLDYMRKHRAKVSSG
jgi:hypothetical protein